MKKKAKKDSGKIGVEAIGGVSFMYQPRPEPGRTPCQRKGCKGHVVWVEESGAHHFICSISCGWNSKGLKK